MGTVVTQGLGPLGGPWGAPLPCGLLRGRGGWGCVVVGIKITPRPSSWKVDGVGVHSMLTNSIHPEGGNCEVLSPHLRRWWHGVITNVVPHGHGLHGGCVVERGGVELVLVVEDVPGDTGCVLPGFLFGVPAPVGEHGARHGSGVGHGFDATYCESLAAVPT